MLCQDGVGRGQVCVEGVEQESEGAELLDVTDVLQQSGRPGGLVTHFLSESWAYIPPP